MEGGVIQALDHPWLHLQKTHGVLSQWRPETHEGWGDPVSENRTEESKTSQSTLLSYYWGTVYLYHRNQTLLFQNNFQTFN